MFGRRTLIIACVVLVAGAALAAFGFRRQHTTHQPAPVATRGQAEEDETPRADVTIDTRRQQLIGVRTVPAHRMTMAPQLRAAGTIAWDETRQAEINTRVDGWIRDLRADYTGRAIRRGETLFTLYSPDLIAAQNEYLLALRGRSTSEHESEQMRGYTNRLVDAARERLLRLDMTVADVSALEATGHATEMLPFKSPVSGIIVEKTAVRGMRVVAGQTLFKVADLSSVWVEAEVPQMDLASVRVGMPATVVVDAYPDRTFRGRVSYVYPTVTEQTRTARVRLALANADSLLKPNMLATVSLETTAAEGLVVPNDAVVDTGTDHLVFVADGNGHFSPRNVRVGRRVPGQVEILSGLQDGDVVAASATFFLDSESQLQGAIRNYESPSAENATTPAAAGAPHVAITFRSEPEEPKVGDATFIVTLGEQGQPVSDAAVTVDLLMPAMPSMNMPAMHAEATLVATGGGVYRGTAPILMAGRWQITVTATRAGHPAATGHFALIAR